MVQSRHESSRRDVVLDGWTQAAVRPSLTTRDDQNTRISPAGGRSRPQVAQAAGVDSCTKILCTVSRRRTIGRRNDQLQPSLDRHERVSRERIAFGQTPKQTQNKNTKKMSVGDRALILPRVWIY